MITSGTGERIHGEPCRPDGAPARDVLLYLRWCARSWQGEARLIGNLRACDIVRAVDEVIGERERVLNDAANLARGVGVRRHISDTPRRMREAIADLLDRMALLARVDPPVG